MNVKPVSATKVRWRWLVLALYIAVLLGLMVAWQVPGMRQWMDPQALGQLGRQLLASPLGPLAVVAGYVLAVMAAMPVLVLVSVGALIFPPWPGMLWCMCGTVAGAVVTYGIGRYTGADTVDHWTQGRLSPLARHLERRGLVTMIAIRVLPVAPFIMVNLAAGALRVKLRDYVLGTFIGLIPAHLMLFMFMGTLSQAWRAPGLGSWAMVAACVALIGVGMWWLRRRLAPLR